MKLQFCNSVKYLLCAVSLLLGTATFARKAVIVTLTSTTNTLAWGSTPNTYTITGGGTTTTRSFTNLSDAADSLNDPALLYGAFGVGTSFNGVINVMGLNIKIGFNAGTNVLDFEFYNGDGLLTSQTFTGTSQNDVFNQLENFFQSDAGVGVFNDYMAGVQKYALLNFISGSESPVGQSIRDNTLRAMGKSLTEAERNMLSIGRGTGIFSIGAEYTKFENDSFSGESYTVPIVMGGRLGKSMSLEFRMPLNYTDIEGTEFYRFGTELDLGVVLVGTGVKSPFEWEITPTAGNYLAGTTDLLVGGDIYNYGVQNRFQVNQGPFSVAYGLYYGWYKSAEISIGNYDVDLNVDEKVISNGLKFMYRIGRNMVIDVYGIESGPDGTDGFRDIRTIGGNFSMQLGNTGSAGLRLGYAKDEGQDSENDDFEAERYYAELVFRY